MSKTVEQSLKGIEKLGQPENSRIRRVIAVMSGKGGVGKSSLAALLAVEFARRGRAVAVMDADVTGPSIPKLFGLKAGTTVLGNQLIPGLTRLGIRVMSLNLLLEREDDPVIWRGPLIASAIKQFWSDVLWEDVDYMVLDLPPGTGDAPLTVLQSLPVDGVVMASTPQDLSKLVVKKAVNMARALNVPLLGLVENMAWIECPNCHTRIEPFGHVDREAMAKEMGIDLLGSLPLDPQISTLGDKGLIEDYKSPAISAIVDLIEKKVPLAASEPERSEKK